MKKFFKKVKEKFARTDVTAQAVVAHVQSAITADKNTKERFFGASPYFLRRLR